MGMTDEQFDKWVRTCPEYMALNGERFYIIAELHDHMLSDRARKMYENRLAEIRARQTQLENEASYVG